MSEDPAQTEEKQYWEIPSEIESNIEQNSNIYAALLNNPDSISYISSDTSPDPPLSDMAIFSPIHQIPKIVTIHYQAAAEKATFGCFSAIDKFYSIIDNKLFVWAHNTSEPEQNMENTSVITCVALYDVNDDLKAQRKINHPNEILNHVLVVATPKYIRIYFVNNQQINFTDFKTVDINFSPFCIANGPFGQIVLGSSNGGIYLLEYQIDSDNFIVRSISRNYQNSIFGFFSGVMNTILNYQTPAILQLCFDTSKEHLAAIDENEHLHIYKYNNGYCTVMGMDSKLAEYQFKSVCATPTTDPSFPYFTAFCENGTRILLGNGNTFSIREPPVEFPNDEVVSGQAFMGYTVILGKKSIAFLRGQLYHEKTMYELVTKVNLNGIGVALDISNFDSNISDPLIWQHNHQSPVLYLFTTCGGYKITFSPPYQTLSRLIITSRGKETKALQDYFSNANEHEIVPSALLACYNQPQYTDLILYVVSQYSERESLRILKEDPKNRSKSLLQTGVNKRMELILEPIWNSFLLEQYQSKKNETKYRVPITLVEPFQMINGQLSHLKSLLNQYIKNRILSSTKDVRDDSEFFQNEEIEMKTCIKDINQILEFIAFFGILHHQKKGYITQLINLIETKGKNEKQLQDSLGILTKCTFGQAMKIILHSPNHRQGFLDALRHFARFIIMETKRTPDLDLFCKQLYESCPSLASQPNENSQFKDAFNELAAATFETDPTSQRIRVRNAAKVLINYISLCNATLLKIIIKNILSKECQEPLIALQVLEAKIQSADPKNIALRYFKDRKEEDKTKFEEIFDYLSYPVEHILSYQDGMDIMMTSKLEIIHIHIFNQLIENQEDLLIHLNSPYLKEYITDYKPEILWKYYLVHNNLSQCYKELVKNANQILSDNEKKATNEKRKPIVKTKVTKVKQEPKLTEETKEKVLQYLLLAKTYAQKSNASYDEIQEIVNTINKVKNK